MTEEGCYLASYVPSLLQEHTIKLTLLEAALESMAEWLTAMERIQDEDEWLKMGDDL